MHSMKMMRFLNLIFLKLIYIVKLKEKNDFLWLLVKRGQESLHC